MFGKAVNRSVDMRSAKSGSMRSWKGSVGVRSTLLTTVPGSVADLGWKDMPCQKYRYKALNWASLWFG